MQRDAIYLSRLKFGIKAADRWRREMADALDRLATYPPMYEVANVRNAIGEVRAMLVGRGSSTYRVLYRVIDPDGDDAGLVREYDIRHASRDLPDNAS